MTTVTNHIEFRPNRRGEDRAYVAGTRVRVQDIVSDHELHGMTADEIAREYPHLSLAQVHAALSYYFDHRELVRSQMKSDRDFASQHSANHSQGTAADGDSDSVSS